jgi:serine/threonine protein kinase
VKNWVCEFLKSDKFYKQTTKPDLQEKDFANALPSKIGPYKVEGLLSKGGMSLLYLGIDPETHHPIAIKVLLPKYLKNKEVASLFLKEAQIIKMANHPNIVRLYGEGEWEKGLYIAMELVRGISLRQFIQHQSLTVKRALEIVLQVAYALCHLHAHGVIHRDLKPENILITESGEIKVIDFGIAQLKDDPEERKKLVGTPVYMSPEQKKNPNRLTVASDVYALGIIAYELVLGKLSHGVVNLSFLPAPLAEIIGKAIDPDVRKRYQDVVEFITDISQYIKNQEEEKDPSFSKELFKINELVQMRLFSKKLPKWNQLEIGLADREGEWSQGFYLDFFHFPDNCYCIVMAKPDKSTRFGFLASLFFHGLVKMAMREKLSPVEIANTLNEILLQEGKSFSFALLSLYPNKDQLSFIGCGLPSLWSLPEGSDQIRKLSTPNPKLGEKPASTFLEIVDNWDVGDCLYLLSFAIEKIQESKFNLLSAQHQAEKLLEYNVSKETSAAICFVRS